MIVKEGTALDCDLLIDNGCLAGVDGHEGVLDDGAVAVRDGRIAAVGHRDEIIGGHTPKRLINASGALVHPGLIDPHLHLSYYLSRGAVSQEGAGATAADFTRWIDAMEPDEEGLSATAAFVEALRSGYTMVQDPGTVFEPDAVAAAAQAAGIRCSLGDPYLWDQHDIDGEVASLQGRVPADPARASRLLGGQLARNCDPEALVRGHVAVYGMGSASDELLADAKACAREAGVVFAMHQSFSAADAFADAERFSAPPLVHLDRLGVLDESTALTHLNLLAAPEIELLERTGTLAVWHPANQLFYALGVDAARPLARLAADGASVTVCSDVPKSWSIGDVPLVAFLAARLADHLLPAARVLELATAEAAKAVGMGDELGVLAVGRRADIVVRSASLPWAAPSVDPVAQHAIVGRQATVDTVVVAGRVVVEEGHCVLVDEGDVAARAQQVARRIVRRAQDRTPAGA